MSLARCGSADSMTHLKIAVSALVALAGPVSAQQVVPNELLIEVNRAYSPALTAAIAKLGRPDTQVLEAGETVPEVIRRRCGTLEAVYLAAFLSENKIAAGSIDATKLASFPTGVAYRFPACLHSPTAERTVQTHENPSAIYQAIGVPFVASAMKDPQPEESPPVTQPLRRNLAQFGALGEELSALVVAAQGFDGSEAARVFAKRNEGVDPTKLNTGNQQSTLSIPATQRSGIIELRAGVDLLEAKEALQFAIDSSPQSQGAPVPMLSATTGVNPNAGTVSDVTLAELIDPVAYEGACAWQDGSPVSLADLRFGRAENERLRAGEPRKAKVLVIDTGYDERLGPPAITEENLGELAAFRDDDDPKHYHGFNPVDQNRYTDPTPPANWTSAMHGGQVAATMLGGRFLSGQDRRAVPLEVTFASLAKGTALRAEGANAAIEFAAQQRIDIVNTSFVARSPFETFLRVLKESNPPLLVITAAGNAPSGNPSFSGSDDSWPGRFGGEMAFSNSPALILSVGAHGPSGELLPFSRKGRGNVDLLAPGCKIPTYTLSEDGRVAPIDASGTSFAAPIVTLVAGELFQEGLSPARVRNRILASVDIDQSLDGVVWTSGTLNVRKALSVYRDFVSFTRINDQTKEKETLQITGTLTNAGETIRCGGQEFPYASIDKFAFAGSRGSDQIAIKNYVFLEPLSAGGRFLRPTSCTADELATAKPLWITNATTGEKVPINLADVIDFVARSYTPNQLTD